MPTKKAHGSSKNHESSGAHPLQRAQAAETSAETVAETAPPDAVSQETLSSEHYALAANVEGDTPELRAQRLQAHRVWRAGLQATDAALQARRAPAPLARPSPVASGVAIDGHPIPRQRVERVVRTPKP